MTQRRARCECRTPCEVHFAFTACRFNRARPSSINLCIRRKTNRIRASVHRASSQFLPRRTLPRPLPRVRRLCRSNQRGNVAAQQQILTFSIPLPHLPFRAGVAAGICVSVGFAQK